MTSWSNYESVDDALWDAENNEDALAEAVLQAGAQHVLILIDCHPSMFTPCLPDPDFPEDLMSPMDWTCKAVEQVLRSVLRTTVTVKTGKRDGVGVLLYNTRLRKPVVEDDNDAAASSKRNDDEKEDDDDDDDDEAESGMPSSSVSNRDSTSHVLLPLAPPGVAAVKRLQSVQDDPIQGRIRDLQQDYGWQDDDDKNMQESSGLALRTALAEALVHYSRAPCVRQRLGRSQAPDQKRIWIFTNQDNPCQNQASTEMRIMQTTASDIRDNGMELVVWPVLDPTKRKVENDNDDDDDDNRHAGFDYDLFYNQISAQTPAQGLEEEALTNTADLVREMRDVWKKTRPSFGVPLVWPDYRQADPGRPDVALDFYRLVQPSTVPSGMKIHQETGRAVKMVSRFLSESGHILTATAESSQGKTRSSRLRTFCEFGGSRVPMSERDKVAALQENSTPEFASLLVLGFRDRDTLLRHNAIAAPYFVYPNETRVQGSREAFVSLHGSMLRKNVYALCELLQRVTARARLVAMWPVEEELEEEEIGDQVVETIARPPGMIVVPLPYSDDVKVMDNDAAMTALESTGEDLASEKLVECAMALAEELTIPDVEIGEMFENARLAKFWDYIEHAALEEAMPDDREYDTMVKADVVLKVAGPQIEAFSAALPEDVKPERTPTKRKAAELVVDDSGIDWEACFLEGRVAKCTQVQLKQYLKSVGLKVAGVKRDQVLRVENHIKEQMAARKEAA